MQLLLCYTVYEYEMFQSSYRFQAQKIKTKYNRFYYQFKGKLKILFICKKII